MVVLRKFVGWLCFLSLVASIVLLGAWLYIMTWPYFKGTVSWYGPRPDLDVLSQSLVESVDSEYNRVLRDYISREAEPDNPRTGFDAAVRVLTDYAYFPPLNRVSQGAAAALIDVTDGRVLAAYPRSLEGLRVPFPIHFIDRTETGVLYLRDRADYSPYRRWQADFLDKACGVTNPPYEVRLTPVADQSGEAIGVLAVVYYSSPFVLASEAIGYERPEWLIRLSSYGGKPSAPLWPAALLFSLVLLPWWVALDSAWRGMRPVPWTLLALLTSFIGLLAYLIARIAPPRPCPNCGEPILSKYKRCPACGVAFLSRCPVCGRRMRLGWQYCPVCAGEPAAEPQEPMRRSSEGTDEPGQTIYEEMPILPEAGERLRLTVEVLDAESGIPLQEADVSIEGVSSMRGFTNHTGRFDARSLAPGDLTVVISKQGYQSVTSSLFLSEDAHVRLALQPASGVVAGKALDRVSLQPIAGAHVYVDSSRVNISALTKQDGSYSLADVPVGPYTVCADAPGFLSQVKLAEVAPGARVVLDFALELSPSLDAMAGPNEGDDQW